MEEIIIWQLFTIIYSFHHTPFLQMLNELQTLGESWFSNSLTWKECSRSQEVDTSVQRTFDWKATLDLLSPCLRGNIKTGTEQMTEGLQVTSI
jgi:DNA phosphorothioation-dependent restriction protein DptG